MKKLIYILIIPLFISCYQETNLDFLFNGSIEPSDSTLIDSLTGVSNTNYKLTDIDFDITLDYIPGKTKAKLNGQPICTFFQNANYADTLFTQWLDQELNTDLTESLPYRIQRIAHYSTPTPDVNDFFQTPHEPITTFIVPNNYANVEAAITAASANDTILVKDSDFTGVTNSDKSIVIMGVGNSVLRRTTASPYVQTVGELTMLNMSVISGSGAGITMPINASVNHIVSNCYLSGTLNINDVSNNDDTITFNNCLIDGYSYKRGSIISNENFYIGSGNTYIYRVQGNINSNYDYFENINSTIILNEGNIEDINIFDGVLNNTLLTQTLAVDTNINLHITKSTIDVESQLYFRNTVGGRINISLDSCELIRQNNSDIPLIRKKGDGNIIINKCYGSNFRGQLLQAENDTDNIAIYNCYIDSCVFGSDTTTYIYTTGHNTQFVGDTLTNASIDAFNIDTARSLLINNSIFINTDSVSYNFKNSLNTISNCSFDFDTTMRFILDTDVGVIGGISILNNTFSLNTLREPTLLSISGINNNQYSDGVLIEGNKFFMPRFYGKESRSHMYLNFNNSTIFRYNQVFGAITGCVTKNPEDIPNVTNELHGNLYIDCGVAIYARAMPKTKIYNNTFYNTNYAPDGFGLVHVDDNIALSPPYNNPSDSGSFINNIAYSELGGELLSFQDSSLFGWNINYNDVYGLEYQTDTGGVVSFTEWQAYGYDANSFNTDPNLKSSTELRPISPSDAIGNGFDLSTPYDTALNVNSVWPDSIINKQQFARWSMGAYVPPFETIDNYVADTLMSIWADKMNQTIKIFLNSNDTIELDTP